MTQASLRNAFSEKQEVSRDPAVPWLAARRRLDQSQYPALREIGCDYSEGVLCLSGRVPSFYLKQVAQSLVFPLDGVARLQNDLVVDR